MVLASWNTTKLGPHHWPSSSAKGDRSSNANSLTTWFGLVMFHTHSLCLWRKMFNLKSSVLVLYLKTKVEKGTLNTNTQSQEAVYWKIQDSHKRRWSSREPWSGNHRRGAMVTCNAYLFSLIQYLGMNLAQDVDRNAIFQVKSKMTPYVLALQEYQKQFCQV